MPLMVVVVVVLVVLVVELVEEAGLPAAVEELVLVLLLGVARAACQQPRVAARQGLSQLHQVGS